TEYRTDASGKGVNVTRVLTQLGTKPVHLTQLGYGSDYFLKLTNEDSLNLITAANTSPIRTCTTLINNKKNTVTEIVEESLPVDESTGILILDLYNKLLANTNNVIISGSKAQGFEDTIFPEMVHLAKKTGKTVILDYRVKDLINSIEYNPDIVKINFPEFVSTFFPDYTIGEHEENTELKKLVMDKMLELYRVSGIKTILTRGTMPVLFIDDNGIIQEEKVHKIKPVNTIGSGDAFTAGLAFKLNHGSGINEAVRFGIECGSKNAALLRPGVIR
ncbi:MAG: tagatose-6-phosphate kinase, partial [Spirochaetales bacterium]|nr:tagatose-6-phosphate kinase [Spirochaetales bacterium]